MVRKAVVFSVVFAFTWILWMRSQPYGVFGIWHILGAWETRGRGGYPGGGCMKELEKRRSRGPNKHEAALLGKDFFAELKAKKKTIKSIPLLCLPDTVEPK